VAHYRIVADGPIRAIVEARFERWTIGEDQVSLTTRFEIDAGEGFVRCLVRILPLRIAPSHSYDVGVGIRDLPDERLGMHPGVLALQGEQTAAFGPLGLAVYYDPKEAAPADPITTPESKNQVIVFRERLGPRGAVELNYKAAAVWSGSGFADPLAQLIEEQRQVLAHVEVSGERLDRTPQPQRIEGEAN
jgi:hypothetical protein